MRIRREGAESPSPLWQSRCALCDRSNAVRDRSPSTSVSAGSRYLTGRNRAPSSRCSQSVLSTLPEALRFRSTAFLPTALWGRRPRRGSDATVRYLGATTRVTRAPSRSSVRRVGEHLHRSVCRHHAVAHAPAMCLGQTDRRPLLQKHHTPSRAQLAEFNTPLATHHHLLCEDERDHAIPSAGKWNSE